GFTCSATSCRVRATMRPACRISSISRCDFRYIAILYASQPGLKEEIRDKNEQETHPLPHRKVALVARSGQLVGWIKLRQKGYCFGRCSANSSRHPISNIQHP